MKKYVVLFGCVFSLSGALACFGPETSVNDDEKNLVLEDVVPVLDMETAVENEDGTVTYQVVNAQEVAAFFGKDQVVEVSYTEIVPSEDLENTFDEGEGISVAGNVTEKLFCFEMTGDNQTDQEITKEMPGNARLSNDYDGDPQDAQALSDALGFDVEQTFEISYETTAVVPAHETVDASSYGRYQVYRYDMEDGTIFGGFESGQGTVKQVCGMYTVVTIS